MNTSKIYIVYDRLAQMYGAPTFYLNLKACLRSLKSVYIETPIFNDLDLIYVGEYSTETGHFYIDRMTLGSLKELLENEA